MRRSSTMDALKRCGSTRSRWASVAPRIDSLSGGDATENAGLLRGILAGETGPKRDIVLLNAAAALWVAGASASLSAGLELAAKSIESGAAAAKLAALAEATSRAGEALDAQVDEAAGRAGSG